MLDPANIPGMIEPVEQQLLTELASSAFVANSGIIVEFGCFFGRSTACLANGAAQWWSPAREAPAILAFDSFACGEREGFAPHLWRFAQEGGVQNLVQRQAGRLNFLPVYRHYLGEAEGRGLVATTQVELRAVTHPGGPIALMHIDAPKTYEDLKYVLFRFFPHLVADAMVVFQDYFYHWSATLIAAAQVLVEAGVLKFERSAASSAVARVLRVPTETDLLQIDLAMTSTPIANLLGRSLKTAKGMELDRAYQFVPRLYLARLQHHWLRGEYQAARETFLRLLNACGGSMSQTVLDDYLEMMSQGFGVGTSGG